MSDTLVAVSPPGYFPGLPFVALAGRADTVVLADTFRYSRQAEAHRTRLRTPQGSAWATVPVQRRRGAPLCETRINYDEPWVGRHTRALQYNYRGSPYFEFYEDDLLPLFDDPPATLGAMAVATCRWLLRRFNVAADLVLASDLDGAPDDVASILQTLPGDAEDLALLAEAEQARYETETARAVTGGPPRVLHVEPFTYRQHFDGFEGDLSALDLLFNYGPEAAGLLYEHVYVEELSG